MRAEAQSRFADTVNAPESLIERVLYRDGLVLVIDKPAGIKVHATAGGGGAALNARFDSLRYGLPRAPALAHRLDRDTSGCLVLGRHPKALRRLGRLFAEGRVEKIYWAAVEGAPPDEAGRIEAALSSRGGIAQTDAAGQVAISDYRVLGRSGGLAWLELRPRTGRMHQLRVHCAALGCPILGDGLYGRGGGAPMHLHARAVALPLYPKRPPISVTAPVPAHMRAALEACDFADD